MAQCLRLCSQCRVLGLIPGQGTIDRFHMLQQRSCEPQLRPGPAKRKDGKINKNTKVETVGNAL